MPRPAILAVDDDPRVLFAVERDLRTRYGAEYRVLRSESGAAALGALEALRARGQVAALLISDHRMPEMDGVAFLGRAREIFPEAKRVLLTAYADTDAAIRSINETRLDHYLLKPWDPPAERLYPALDDLLADWRAGYRPPFEGVRVVGHRWSPDAHRLRDFLSRNGVPYVWLDVEADVEAQVAARSLGEELVLPAVILPDGPPLTNPSNAELGERVGLRSRAEQPFYDLVVVGAGPSGLAAAVYGASEGLRTALIEREAPGGQAGMSSRIENYLGFPHGLSGGDLARRATDQARRLGAELLVPQEVTAIRVAENYRELDLSDGSCLRCAALLVATGVSYARLDVPGVDQLTGAGVYYGAAMTEAANCRGEDVFIVGGANSAGQAAMYFSRYARSVTMLVRGDGLVKSMSRYLIDQIGMTENIRVLPHARVVEALGETHLEGIVVRIEGEEDVMMPARMLFTFIGATPRTDWLGDAVVRDGRGFVIAGPDLPRDERGRVRGWPLEREPYLLETSVPGVFVAGDVRYGSVKRVASGVGEGAIAVSFVHQYLGPS